MARRQGVFWVMACLALAGCASPAYYFQAAGGQIELVGSRQEVSALLQNPATPPALGEQLDLANRLLEFADQELALPAGKSYQTYVATGREAVVWNVVAAPELSLSPKKWCFLVVGCVPYRGYFSESAARAFARKLANRGFDVAVSPAAAYSTLGWFRDPLLDTVLAQPPSRVADTLFHELAHQKLYVKGDTAFSESYAQFVAFQGVLNWLGSAADQQHIDQWLRQQQASQAFQALVDQASQRLQQVYGSTAPDIDKRQSKTEVFRELQQDYRRLVQDQWQGHSYFERWFSAGPNNASLALHSVYESGFCAFQELFHLAQGAFDEFHRLARIQAELPGPARAAWLSQTC